MTKHYFHNVNSVCMKDGSLILVHILLHIPVFDSKGNRAFADLRYEKEDSISPSTIIFAATKG